MTPSSILLLHLLTVETWELLVSFAVLLFFIGISWLVLNWKNFLLLLLCIELFYFGIAIAFIFTGLAASDIKGHIVALLLVILAAAESAVGLGLLIVLYNFGNSIDFEDYHELHS